MFKEEKEEIKKETQKIHSDSEKCESDNIFFDWRNKRTQQNSNISNLNFKKSFFQNNNRFYNFQWSSEKKNTNYFKKCPSKSCQKILDLSNFNSNQNMHDGLDLYCINCNKKNRMKRKNRYTKSVNYSNEQIDDKFELFKINYEDEKIMKHKNEKREILKKIELAITLSQIRFKRKLDVNPTEIYERIFNNDRIKFICNNSFEQISQECFLEHHTVTFEIQKKKLQIFLNDCDLKKKNIN